MLHALRRCANRTIRANVDARRSRPQRRFTHKIAIVGSGPAGFYAAEELIQSYVDCTIDILEKLPTPFGLVRSGVAPDHPEVKVRSYCFASFAVSSIFLAFVSTNEYDQIV
jgi:NADPH-dependent glutamate synthase beta subunit-like oxidoreductase